MSLVNFLLVVCMFRFACVLSIVSSMLLDTIQGSSLNCYTGKDTSFRLFKLCLWCFLQVFKPSNILSHSKFINYLRRNELYCLKVHSYKVYISIWRFLNEIHFVKTVQHLCIIVLRMPLVHWPSLICYPLKLWFKILLSVYVKSTQIRLMWTMLV